TFRPSAQPTPLNMPSSHPSLYPTFSASSFDKITYITVGGTYEGNWTREEIRINCSTNVIVNIQDYSTVNRFLIYRQRNVTITFNNFNLLNIIYFSLFPELTQMAELSYSTNPFTILLPHNQNLIFNPLTYFELTNRNFFFADASTDSSNPGKSSPS